MNNDNRPKTAAAYNSERGVVVGAFWFEPSKKTERDNRRPVPAKGRPK
jgi:hypothetical protein